MPYEELIQRIEERLKALGLSERKACLKAALGVDAIRNIRRGYAPRAETLKALARVSTIVRNDGKFFRRLEEGAGCTMDTYGKCLRWFSEHWPEEAPWPDGVPRPSEDEGREAA